MRDFDIDSDLKQEKFQSLKLVQGDRGNKIKINVYEDGQPVNLAGCSVTAKYKRADGEIINDGVIENIHDNSFDAVMDSSITKVAGTLKMLFTIEKDDVKVSTFLLLADVRESIGENTGSSGGNTGGGSGEVTIDLSNYYKKIETYSKNQIDARFKDIVNEIDGINKLYINLSKFGVKPSSQVSYDETTKTYNLSDCSDKIKATLDNKENVVIIFEKGNYLIDNTIILPKNTKIIGNGANIYINPKETSFTVFAINNDNCCIEELNFYSQLEYKNTLKESDASAIVSNICGITIVSNTTNKILNNCVKNCKSKNLSFLVSNMKADNTILSDLVIDEAYFGIYSDNCNNLKILNTKITTQTNTDIYGHAIYLGYNSNNVVIDNNDLRMNGTGSNIIKCGSNDGAVNNIIVKNTKINGIITSTLFYLHNSSDCRFINCDIEAVGNNATYTRLLQFNDNSKCEFIDCNFILDSFEKITQNYSYVNNSIIFKKCSLKILNSINKYCVLRLVAGSKKLQFINSIIDYSGTNYGINIISEDIYSVDLYNSIIMITNLYSLGWYAKNVVKYTKTNSPHFLMTNSIIENIGIKRTSSMIGYVTTDSYTPDIILNNISCINCIENNNDMNIKFTDAEKDYRYYNNVISI